ncbi:MAG: hypothetical protein JW902_19330 [Syntrophaceae bacterium]|nr:hypothetical protein [Syntrophaceae bacterium]
MGTYKGTGIVFLRSLLERYSHEAAFLAGLTPEEKDVYQKTLPISWVPIQQVDALFIKAAAQLKPGASQDAGLRYIGEEMAKDNLKGLYRILIKAFTISVILKQAAKLWGVYHGQGVAKIANQEEKQVDFVVEAYPDLPERFAESVSGYIGATIAMSGAKEVRVNKEPNHSGWTWHVQWQ